MHAMHHAHPDSCLVYIQRTAKDLREKMRATEAYGKTTPQSDTEDNRSKARPIASYRDTTWERRQ